MRPGRSLAGLAGWLALTMLAAALGGVASIRATSFYLQLERPAWAPPPWLFGPVWTLLYVLMALAAWLVWRRGHEDGAPVARRTAARRGLGLYVAQLALNALWTWLFFTWRRGALAFAEVVLLAVAVALTIVAFRRVSGPAAALLLPYLAWVAFAAALTFAVWQRNPGLL
jgi:tryptophan-rich sensory protein